MSDDPLPRGDEDLHVTPTVRVPGGAMRLQFSRSGGPGGQNVNKLNTKAELWVSLEGIVGMDAPALERLRRIAGKRLTRQDELHLSSQSERSQEENRQIVLQRLRAMLRTALRRPKKRKKTRPTKASRQRRLEGKKQQGEKKSLRRKPPSEGW